MNLKYSLARVSGLAFSLAATFTTTTLTLLAQAPTVELVANTDFLPTNLYIDGDSIFVVIENGNGTFDANDGVDAGSLADPLPLSLERQISVSKANNAIITGLIGVGDFLILGSTDGSIDDTGLRNVAVRRGTSKFVPAFTNLSGVPEDFGFTVASVDDSGVTDTVYLGFGSDSKSVGGLYRFPVDGSLPYALERVGPVDMGNVTGLAVDPYSRKLYYAQDDEGSQILALDLDAAAVAPEVIATSPDANAGLAASGGFLYACETDLTGELVDGSIVRYNLGASPVTSEVYVDGLDLPIGITSDGTYFYFAEFLDFTVSRVLISNPTLGDDCADAIDAERLFAGANGARARSSAYDLRLNSATDGEIGASCAGGTADLSQYFTFTGDGEAYSIRTVSCATEDDDVPVNLELAIYTGTCDALVEVACNDDESSLGALFLPLIDRFETEADTRYTVQVDAPNTTVAGIYCLEVVQLEASSATEAAAYGWAIGPNPTDGRLALTTGDTPISRAVVTDLAGRHLMDIARPSGSLDISALAPGVYAVTLHGTGGQTATVRIVRQQR